MNALGTLHQGGCHCGAVRFEVRGPAHLEVLDCNCSICSLSGYLHLIVHKDDFRLLRGESAQSEYRFGTGVARHFFCATCGVKSFYIPRSHPDKVSVSARALQAGTVTGMTVVPFEGRDWERARLALAQRESEG